MADGATWQRWFLIVLTTIVTLILIAWYARLEVSQKLERVALICIIGGALGNLYDRLRYAYVVDFIEVYYKKHYWPAFNVADSFISVGVVLLLFALLFCQKKNTK